MTYCQVRDQFPLLLLGVIKSRKFSGHFKELLREWGVIPHPKRIEINITYDVVKFLCSVKYLPTNSVGQQKIYLHARIIIRTDSPAHRGIVRCRTAAV